MKETTNKDQDLTPPNDAPKDRVWMSPRDVAEYLGVCRPMLNIMIKDGSIPAPARLSKCLQRWNRSALDAYLLKSPESGK